MIRRASMVLMLASALAQAQQPVVVVRDAGPGPAGRFLTEILAKPGTRVIVADTLKLTRDSVYPASVVAIAKRVELTGTVHGDLVVVGGDLFLKPGGVIDGEGTAIGGGAYGSLLGTVRDGLTSYRDLTFEATTTGGRIELSYRENYVASTDGLVTLPGVFGFRIPSYDRSNGLSLGVGPRIARGHVSAEPVVTYRSQIGKIDPSISARAYVNRRMWLDADGGRETRTRDAWINGRLTNSLNSIISGHDERNWYRATFAEARLSRMFETPTMTATWSLGGSLEDALPARPGLTPTSGPWSITQRKDTVDGMYRANPQVAMGDIGSVIAGAAYQWRAGELKARLDVDLEVPVSVSTGQSFQQATVEGRVEFPTFGKQSYRLEVHGVLTTGDTAPSQRFSYIGGPGTLPTEELMTSGGDELLYIESRYDIPLSMIKLPVAGIPTITLRHILGAAGAHSLPDLTQIVGLRLSASLLRVQLLMDTDTRETKFSAGLSLNR